MTTSLSPPPTLGLLAQRAIYSVYPTGAIAETCPRWAQISSLSPASGDVRLFAITLPAGLTITSITFVSTGTGATTPTHQIFGLYDNAASPNLLRGTVDDTTTAWNANTAKTLNLTTTYTTTYEGLYYVGFLITAATPPDIICMNGPVLTGVYSLAPITHGKYNTGASALPNPATLTTALDRVAYAYLK